MPRDLSPHGATCRRGLLPGALCAALAVWSAPALWAQNSPTPPPSQSEQLTRAEPPLRLDELNPRTRQAIDEGAAWLAGQQLRGGNWPSQPQHYQMAITSLAGLALLAHGDTPSRGRYADNVRRAVEWVVASQQTTTEAGKSYEGLFFEQPIDAAADHRPMHGHGFALLFLGEAYGEIEDPELKRRCRVAIERGVRLTERGVSREGGWFYLPFEQRDEGSVTITQIQGLRSARNAGVDVDVRVVEKAVEYIRRSQDEDGGIRYTLSYGRSSAALTAAGISVLQGAGEYHSRTLDKAYEYLRQNLSVDFTDPKTNFYFYTHLYAVQAMFQRGGPEWVDYYPRIRDELLKVRRGQVYWDGPFGKCYGTAMSLLILEVPLRYLPIFQR